MENFITQNPERCYPILKIDHIQNPNRFFAFPLLGGFVKIILLIPVGIELAILFTGQFFVTIINSFYVLFTRKYWSGAYQYSLGVMRLTAKTTFYFNGLTNSYPGFDFNLKDFTLDIPQPASPNRLYAIPFLGIMIRFILLIPYLLWNQILGSASNIGIAISSFWVLIRGRYPESTYELARDSFRVSQGSSAYLLGLSDTYPSFYISFNHKNIKIALIIIGLVLTFSGSFSSSNSKTVNNTSQNNQVACTQDAQQCPDGSFVGRIPPKCDFAPCPVD